MTEPSANDANRPHSITIVLSVVTVSTVVTVSAVLAVSMVSIVSTFSVVSVGEEGDAPSRGWANGFSGWEKVFC